MVCGEESRGPWAGTFVGGRCYEVTRIHEILLGGGVTIVEALPDYPVLFGAMPLKIQKGDGCPCRAWASTETIQL